METEGDSLNSEGTQCWSHADAHDDHVTRVVALGAYY